MTQVVGSVGTDILILRVKPESIRIYDALKSLSDDQGNVRRLLTTTSKELGNLRDAGAIAALVFFPLSNPPPLSDTGEGKVFFNTSRKRFQASFDTFPFFDFPTPESARVTHSIDQTLPNGAYTVITFDTVRYNHINVYNAATPTRLTAPIDGRYGFGLNISIDDANTGHRGAQIRKNGAIVIASDSRPTVLTLGANTDISLCGEGQFAAGDYIEALSFQNSGGVLATVKIDEYSPEFFMHRLG